MTPPPFPLDCFFFSKIHLFWYGYTSLTGENRIPEQEYLSPAPFPVETQTAVEGEGCYQDTPPRNCHLHTAESLLGMGCLCSKLCPKRDPHNLEQGDGKGDYIAKQNVTVWEYPDDGPDGKLIAKDAKLEVKSLNNFPFLLFSVSKMKERGGKLNVGTRLAMPPNTTLSTRIMTRITKRSRGTLETCLERRQNICWGTTPIQTVS